VSRGGSGCEGRRAAHQALAQQGGRLCAQHCEFGGIERGDVRKVRQLTVFAREQKIRGRRAGRVGGSWREVRMGTRFIAGEFKPEQIRAIV
jgi:hypothetical protein